jgi:hypothetical protein
MCFEVANGNVELTDEVSIAPTTLAIELEITRDDEGVLGPRDITGLGGGGYTYGHEISLSDIAETGKTRKKKERHHPGIYEGKRITYRRCFWRRRAFRRRTRRWRTTR